MFEVGCHLHMSTITFTCNVLQSTTMHGKAQADYSLAYLGSALHLVLQLQGQPHSPPQAQRPLQLCLAALLVELPSRPWYVK